MPILLNTRHERFCMAVAGGKSYTEASIIAGYKNSKYANTNTPKLLIKKGVKERIEELREQFDKETKKKYILDKEALLKKLGEIILNANTHNRDIISGIQLAAKMQGYLTDDINLNVKKPVEEMSDEQLVAMLERSVRGNETGQEAAKTN